MRIDGAKFLLTQDPDSCSNEPIHELHVEIADAGGGPYIVLQTQRWSINPEEIGQFAERLKALLQIVEQSQVRSS
jgi:hypothetical protein